MRFLILPVMLLALAGCTATTSVFDLMNPVANPIGRNEMATIESSFGVTYTAAVAYRRLCAQRAIPPSCRAVVLKLQAAARKAQGALVATRNFVKNNPTVSAVSAIAAARAALADFQSIAAANGVR